MPTDDIVFGIHAVGTALRQNPTDITDLWIESTRHDGRLHALIKQAEQSNIRVSQTTRSELDKQSDGKRHQGVVARLRASIRQVRENDLDTILDSTQKPLLLVLDGVQDPHNLGACLRSADAAGVDAVIAPSDRAVGLTSTVRKVASGAAETVPFITVTNLARSLRGLQQRGLWLIGAAGEAETSLYEINFNQPTAIILGAEEKGLRRLTREICDTLAYIPMAGRVESLNVSVATGVFLFEAVRQRRRAC